MKTETSIKNTLIIIRGAGDLATGSAIRLRKSGFPVIMLEIEKPTVIRTTVSFATAVFNGQQTVEGVTAVRCSKEDAIKTAFDGNVPVVVDPECECIKMFEPEVVIDAILAKRNCGTTKDMAPFVLALGPGFTAPLDCHAVVETQRGHTLGMVIYNGSAIENTGIPGIIGGVGKERVLHAPCSGIFKSVSKIGDIVSAGSTIAYVDNTPVVTEIGGKVRGMLTDGLCVPTGFKVADVDPRGAETDHTTCSDKARAISGGVLEAVLHYLTEAK